MCAKIAFILSTDGETVATEGLVGPWDEMYEEDGNDGECDAEKVEVIDADDAADNADSEDIGSNDDDDEEDKEEEEILEGEGDK